jgi:hypothetical protein
MESLFTPMMWRVWRFSKRLRVAPLPSLVGARLRLSAPSPAGFDAITRALEAHAGGPVAWAPEGRGLALATLEKYDFADLRLSVEPSALERHRAVSGIEALRLQRLLVTRPSSDDDARAAAEDVFDMYENGLTSEDACLHLLARARRSWWTRVTMGDRARGRLPATLIAEHAVVSNCRLPPWEWTYI